MVLDWSSPTLSCLTGSLCFFSQQIEQTSASISHNVAQKKWKRCGQRSTTFPKRRFLSIQAVFCHADVCSHVPFPHLDYKYFLIIKIDSWFLDGQPPPPKLCTPDGYCIDSASPAQDGCTGIEEILACFYLPVKKAETRRPPLFWSHSEMMNEVKRGGMTDLALRVSKWAVWSHQHKGKLVSLKTLHLYENRTPCWLLSVASSPSPWHFNPEPKPLSTQTAFPHQINVCVWRHQTAETLISRPALCLCCKRGHKRQKTEAFQLCISSCKWLRLTV